MASPAFNPLSLQNGLQVSTFYDAPTISDDPSMQLMSELNRTLDGDADMEVVDDEEDRDPDHSGQNIDSSDSDSDDSDEDDEPGSGYATVTLLNTEDEHTSPSRDSSAASEVWDTIPPSKKDDALHKKAHTLTPHVLPPERYWVAVLLHSANPKETRKEKDFVWLKANRKNTVETIWQFYRDVTTEEKFRLTIHEENPDFEDTIEELDFYDDRLVVFRAVLNVIYID